MPLQLCYDLYNQEKKVELGDSLARFKEWQTSLRQRIFANLIIVILITIGIHVLTKFSIDYVFSIRDDLVKYQDDGSSDDIKAG